jgi:hypothetical protein
VSVSRPGACRRRYPARDLRAARRAQLGENVLDVGAYRSRGNRQLGGDLRVGETGGDQPGDFELAGRERVPRLRLGMTAANGSRELLNLGCERTAAEAIRRGPDVGQLLGRIHVPPRSHQ